MEYVFFGLIGVLAIVLFSIWKEHDLMRKLKKELREGWLKVPEEEYTTEKMESMKAYYYAVRDDRLDVDDITWNDLDMDEIFMLMNNTQSAIGEEYLYALLRKPCFSKEELEERNRLISYFGANEEKRIELQLRLQLVGKLKQISVYEYINRLGDQKTESNLPHYLMALGMILSLLSVFYQPAIGGFAVLIFVGNNIWRYYSRKAKIDKFFTVFSYMLRLFENAEQIIKLDIPELNTYFNQIKNDLECFRTFRRGAGIVVSTKVSGSIIDAILDYIRMLFHIDLIKYNNMLSIFKKNRESLNRIFVNIGILDSCLAAASFRDKILYYSIPELSKSKQPSLSVIGLYHPLLSDPVTNSITEDRSVLITGSNASGKSTFIKTLAINALLSQTIYTSLSKGYKASYFMIYSSMALRDNIFHSESYYIVEIKSLKRILDRVNKEIPILCFIDEVLRGTNTLERIAASSRILLTLAKENTLCFAATHDIELTHILENYYSNYHFQERIDKKQILFDYMLYKGRAISKNAIKLLSLLGYSTDIIEAAESAANEFQREGEWRKIR